MLNVADCLVAGFIFLLFVSVYRKRSSAAVRFWVVGWFCVVLHFAAQVLHPATTAGTAARDIAALCTLVLCGTAFALSHPKSHRSTRDQIWVGSLLGVPWLVVMIFGSLSARWYPIVAIFAVVSLACTLGVGLRVLGLRSLRFCACFLLVIGCGVWLTQATMARDGDAVICVVLTLCFGLNAVLLSGRKPVLSVATVTTSFGAICWAMVWVSSSLISRWAPAAVVSPELWNLPKYFVAAGMILSLLEEEIRSTEVASDQYRLLFASNPHPMWIYDRDTLAFLEVNDSAVSYYGYTRDEFRQMTLLDIVDAGTAAESLEELRTDEPQVLSGPWIHRRRDGSEFQVDIASQPVFRDGQRATFALIHDVTEPQRLHAQLIRQAHHDVLTGLPNRALFEHTLEATLDDARRAERKAAVFCIDLDRFKQINDTYGHSAGDKCLCEMAHRITSRLQGAGTLARTGGDEFMLTLGDLERAESAEHLANLLLYDLKTPVQIDGGEVELVASIGIAVYPDDGETVLQLWRDADAAMYRAKRAGGAQSVRVSREISHHAIEANDIELSLRRAVKTGDLLLYYQPQVTAAGELHSLEALVRFTDPVLRRAAAGRVIAIAEESGLIVPLGEWVLEEVCRQSRAWMDQGLRPVQIAVNVSPLQLNRLNFSLKVAQVLERFQVSPHLIEFEVTESTVMPDSGGSPDQIAMLAGMGIRFSVDDFGTGYSSLGRIHQLPVESLKIDCSFTGRIADRNGTYPTVRAIVALAHTFGMNVVAEGVETEEQLHILRSLECDRMQGYLFSKPLPADAARDFLLRASGNKWQQARLTQSELECEPAR